MNLDLHLEIYLVTDPETGDHLMTCDTWPSDSDLRNMAGDDWPETVRVVVVECIPKSLSHFKDVEL